MASPVVEFPDRRVFIDFACNSCALKGYAVNLQFFEAVNWEYRSKLPHAVKRAKVRRAATNLCELTILLEFYLHLI